MNKKEVWKDVVGYEGLYQVSNLGRVKSIDRLINGRYAGHKTKAKGQLLNTFTNKTCYVRVALNINQKVNKFSVHRLVAQAFIPNPDNKPQVNHKDETQGNNNVNNLEWVTASENVNYGTRNERMAKTHYKKIKVIYSDDTYEIWESTSYFAREYGNGVLTQGISDVLTGRRPKHRGLRFEYA